VRATNLRDLQSIGKPKRSSDVWPVFKSVRPMPGLQLSCSSRCLIGRSPMHDLVGSPTMAPHTLQESTSPYLNELLSDITPTLIYLQ